jgi:hypothetical protein
MAVPALLVGLGTSGIVAVATGSSAAPAATVSPSAGALPSTTAAPQTLAREQGTSRDADRAALAQAADGKAKAKTAARAPAEKARAARAAAKAARKAPALRVVGTRYTRVDLNVRTRDDAGSRLLGVLHPGSKVAITPTVRGDWRFVAYRGAGGWVQNTYLVSAKPKAPTKAKAAAAPGISSAACAGGSAVESGLTPDAVRVHRAICARFPSVRAYGGVRADSLPEHPSGRALDAMTSNTGTGWAIADFVRANAKRLGVSQVIFDRRIWTVQRGSEGWRSFGDRGSATANHEDHVHVTVYGSSGG